jgi:hypothetical protein
MFSTSNVYRSQKRMRATRRNLQVQPKIVNKLPEEHQIYKSKRKFYQKKICLVPFKWKGPKNSYGGLFAGSTQNPKKNYRNIKSTNQNKKFRKKSMFSTLKV